MISSTRTFVDDNGNDIRRIEFADDEPYAFCQIIFSPTDELLYAELYEDGADHPAETMAFEQLQRKFAPISAIGKEETEQLIGAQPTGESDADVPYLMRTALASIGFASVPEGF